MYALSVRQPWAELIARGHRRVERRSWTTRHRGDLLIVASKLPDEEGFAEHDEVDEASVVYGAAVCVVQLTRVTGSAGHYAWHVSTPRRVRPIALRGGSALYSVSDTEIAYSAPTEQPAARPPGVVVLADDRVRRRRRTRDLLRREGVVVWNVNSVEKLLALGATGAVRWLVVSTSFGEGGYRGLLKQTNAVPSLKLCARILIGERGSVSRLAGAVLAESPEAIVELIVPPTKGPATLVGS